MQKNRLLFSVVSLTGLSLSHALGVHENSPSLNTVETSAEDFQISYKEESPHEISLEAFTWTPEEGDFSSLAPEGTPQEFLHSYEWILLAELQGLLSEDHRGPTRQDYSEACALYRLQEEGLSVRLQGLEIKGANLLHKAIELNWLAVIEFLAGVRNKIMNQPNAEGLYPLHLAAYLGRRGATTLLLESGYLVNKLSRHHATALQYAANQKHWGCIHILCEQGAVFSSHTLIGKYILQDVVCEPSLPEPTRHALIKGLTTARCPWIHENNQNPLTYALQRQNAPVVRLLLEYLFIHYPSDKGKQYLQHLLREKDENLLPVCASHVGISPQ